MTDLFQHTSETVWNETSPSTLVVACSDGRFQSELEDFVASQLGITRFDSLHIPGGPGALAPSGIDFTRAHQLRRECRFLIESHSIKVVILVFHGPAPDGPHSATCGDYQRKFPTASAKQIRQQQAEDLQDLMREPMWDGIDLRVLRCEVTRRHTVQFVELPQSPERRP
jgi:hypothetical protein